MNERAVVATYLYLQAIGTLAWWILLASIPDAVAWFQPRSWPAEALLSFWLADSILLIGGSLFTAIAISRKKSWGAISLWGLAVAAWYPTLYCIAVSFKTDEAWLASAMMVAMAGLTLAMATIYGRSDQVPMFIRSTSMPKWDAMLWTFAQVVIFWGTFLWILPKGIHEMEGRFGWSSFSHDFQSFASIALFAIASLLGIWSAIAMSWSGEGTPLPTATAPRLVVHGPYRLVRNPMALAGIVQGLAIGWLLGSWGVILYSIIGGLVWHYCVRPVEEADLIKRFGSSYEAYRNAVGLWIPKPTIGGRR